jgi:glyoxylate/hydroxypyruvate reductase A
MAAGKSARETPEGAILIASGPWDPHEWADAIHRTAPERPVFIWPDVPDAPEVRAAIAYAFVWKPPEGILAGLPNLRAIFSLGAGVDHFIFQEGLPDVPIVRVASADLTRRMSEWVTLQVLLHHRRQREYDTLQAARTWRELAQPAAPDVRVGIMGMGVLGQDAAAILVRLGFAVAGWSRRPTNVAGVQSFHGADQLNAFLARTDILVCLLPLTNETRRILAMPLFAKLAPDGVHGGPILINGGRGGLQVERDIAAALDAGVLKGASLDVFEHEPLPATSPLWGRQNVVITPHAAGWSSPAALVPEMLRQIALFEAGEPIGPLIDRAAGY